MFIIKTLLIILIPVLLVFGTLYYFFSGVVVSYGATTDNLRSVFKVQANQFVQPITSLGITGKPTSSVSCEPDHHTSWVAYYDCEDLFSYPQNTSPISDTAKASYEINAAKFGPNHETEWLDSEYPSRRSIDTCSQRPIYAHERREWGGSTIP